MGQAAARDLIKQGEVRNVIIGDIATDPGRLHDKLRTSEKVSFARIDAYDHNGLVKAIKGVDVVINCAGPLFYSSVEVGFG